MQSCLLKPILRGFVSSAPCVSPLSSSRPDQRTNALITLGWLLHIVHPHSRGWGRGWLTLLTIVFIKILCANNFRCLFYFHFISSALCYCTAELLTWASVVRRPSVDIVFSETVKWIDTNFYWHPPYLQTFFFVFQNFKFFIFTILFRFR